MAMVRLAENVALLSILEQVPEKANYNILPVDPVSVGGRQDISLHQEREILAALVYIAGLTDDRNCVMAAAIVEHRYPSRIDLKLAINKSKPDDNNDVLEKTVCGLRQILEVLSSVARGGNVNRLKTKLYHVVIHVCRDRIMQRLRSKKVPRSGTKADKPRFISLLRSFSDAVMSHGPTYLRDGFGRYTDSMMATMEAAEQSEPGPGEERILRRLIADIRTFLKNVDLGIIIDHLKNNHRVLNPSIGQAVKEKLEKLAHYRKICSSLVGHARELDIFQEYDIESVCIPPSLMTTTQARSITDLNGLLNSLAVSRTGAARLKEIAKQEYRRVCQTGLERLYAEIVSNTLSSGKIHAEVQLLFHYDTLPPGQRPRIIMSTKSACFLCHELFRLHGRYYIPSTHGKLYPGWLLPTSAVSLSCSMAGQLNDRIESHNKRVISELSSSTIRTKIQPGNESVLHQLASRLSSVADSLVSTVATSLRFDSQVSIPKSHSSSSSATTIRPVMPSKFSSGNSSSATIRPRKASHLDSGMGGRTESPSRSEVVVPLTQESISPHSMISSIRMTETDESETKSQDCRINAKIHESQLTDSETFQQSSVSSESSTTELMQGQNYLFELRPDLGPRHVSNSFLNLFLENPGKGTAGSTAQLKTSHTVIAEVEWLSRQKSTTIPDGDIYNIDVLDIDTVAAFGAGSPVVLSFGNELVRIGRRNGSILQYG